MYKVIRGVFIVVVAMFAVYSDMLFVDIDGQDASRDFINFFRLGFQSSSCYIIVGGKLINSFRNSNAWVLRTIKVLRNVVNE